MSGEDNGNARLHILTTTIVGGVILFAFFAYLAFALVVWVATHPRVLVYGFTVLVVIQAYWLLHAWLKSRYSTRRAP